ncbi:hypothetical protein BDF19DRAFT_412210 [Syncephalis fuscata]|nr:hypothetical protein BDF19DRAFT_412210 [Syncephalis fuscata]
MTVAVWILSDMDNKSELITTLQTCCHRLLAESPPNEQDRHVDVYTGMAGLAQLFLHIHELDASFKVALPQKPARSALELAGAYIDVACRWMDATRPSVKELRHCGFLCTEIGIRAVAAVVYQRQERADEAAKQLQLLLSFSVATNMSDTPSELLYGRAGYLYALGYVQSKLVADPTTTNKLKELLSHIDPLIDTTYEAILKDGRQTAKDLKMTRKTPLLWQWHKKVYLGAAHGMAGILTVLMLWPERARKYTAELKAAINFLLFATKSPIEPTTTTEQANLFNWPSSIDTPKSDSHSVRWLLAVWIWYSFVMVHQVFLFVPSSLLEVAGYAAETAWYAGIGHKGVGLCHGVSGNAYLQAILYRMTSKVDYAARVKELVQVCANWEQLTQAGQFRVPDRPWSVWEGLGGVIWLLTDLIYTPSGQCMGFPCLSDISIPSTAIGYSIQQS